MTDMISTNADPDARWSLAGTRPRQLALRFAAAAIGVGVVGGMMTAGLSALFAASDVSPAARFLAIGLPDSSSGASDGVRMPAEALPRSTAYL